jgi:hypothetical protein
VFIFPFIFRENIMNQDNEKIKRALKGPDFSKTVERVAYRS